MFGLTFAPALIRAGIAVAACLALLFAGWTIQGWRMGKAAAELQAQGEAAARVEEDNRREAFKEVAHVARIAKDLADIDRRRADAGHVSLLNAARASAARSQAASDTGASSGSQAAGPAECSVLADVLGEIDEVAGELAASLDAAYIAGSACERAHDTLSQP